MPTSRNSLPLQVKRSEEPETIQYEASQIEDLLEMGKKIGLSSN